jgi:hypothetical protein
MKASSNSSWVAVWSFATATANRSVIAAYAVVSRNFSAQAMPQLLPLFGIEQGGAW